MATKLTLNYTVDSSVIREPDPKDEWDNGCTSKCWYFDSVCVDGEPWNESVEVAENIQPGDTVYCVIAVWSTGDSFGSYERDCMEFIDVFTDAEAARACVDALSKECSTLDKWTVEYTRQDGTKVKFARPWLGYFESLDELKVFQFEVES